jgi:hypothetical protein
VTDFETALHFDANPRVVKECLHEPAAAPDGGSKISILEFTVRSEIRISNF